MSPVHTYATPGTYTATVVATNACGAVTETFTYTLDLSPVAGINSNTTTGCVGTSIQYLDGSSNASSWQWTFPGGNPSSSTLQSPSVSYATPGSYDVTLVITNTVGTDQITITDYVTIEDTPTISPSFTTSALSVNFSSMASGADVVSWDFGDGNTSGLINPTHTYTTPGSYTASVTASNQCGTVTETVTVTVDLVPVAGISANTTSGCVGTQIQYLDASTGANSWQWSFPGGSPSTSTLQSPAVSYAASGSYDVTLIITNSVGADTITFVDYVTIEDVPQLSASFRRTLLTVDFTSNAAGADVVSWDFGDGNTSGLVNPTHTYATPGNYTATVTASNECGTVTDQVTITVDFLPSAGINSNTTSCLLYTSPSPRDATLSRMPSSA